MSEKVSAKNICKEFSDLVSIAHGDPERAATKVCSQNDPKLDALVFVSDPKMLTKLLDSPVSLIVTTEKLAPTVKPAEKTLLATKNVYLAMAMINKKFFPAEFLFQPFQGQRIHQSAIVHKNAQVASTAILGPNVVIHEGVKIGDRTFIGANSVVEANTTIGDDCLIHPKVYIGHTVQMGDRCEIMPNSTIGSDGFGYAHDEKGNHYRLPHVGATIIEDDVHIGANVSVDRGTYDSTRIGAGTKIDNHCHFAHNVVIGKNCLITAGFIVAGSSSVGDNCVFAGRVGVNGHTDIGSDIQIGPNSAVTNDLDKPGAYMGFPPIPMKQALKVNASLASLPRLRRQVAKVMKHLGIEAEET